jgi:hypothetical protein
VHVAIHARTNAFACGKKIIYHAHFSLHILECKIPAILGDKRKGFYITNSRRFRFPVICSPKNKQIKQCNKSNKKNAVAYNFSFHSKGVLSRVKPMLKVKHRKGT